MNHDQIQWYKYSSSGKFIKTLLLVGNLTFIVVISLFVYEVFTFLNTQSEMIENQMNISYFDLPPTFRILTWLTIIYYLTVLFWWGLDFFQPIGVTAKGLVVKTYLFLQNEISWDDILDTRRVFYSPIGGYIITVKKGLPFSNRLFGFYGLTIRKSILVFPSLIGAKELRKRIYEEISIENQGADKF